MEHLIVKLMDHEEHFGEIEASIENSIDGELFDLDVLSHKSTFVLAAIRTGRKGHLAYLPVQQPLMVENFLRCSELTEELAAQSLTRLVEYAISEAYRRDAGELYFLTRDEDTEKFALRHKFQPLPDGLKVYRLNLFETFGC
jgi:hypothetical protein